MDFANKVVLITGASSGIGADTAVHFSKLSAKLVLIGRNVDNLQKVANICKESKGIEPLTISADLTKDADGMRIINETIKHFGQLDVLVNNAAYWKTGGFKTATIETFDKIMSTNLRSVYYLTLLATPHLIKTKGNVVNVSSTVSLKPSSLSRPYGISKAALDYFTKSVALELSADGVRVNSVNPGIVKTNLMRELNLSDDQTDSIRNETMEKNVPLKKIIEGDEVASLIVYLASEKAKNITGAIYVIDGGYHLK